MDLGAGASVAGSAIVTAANYSSYLPADLADGDADTQLDQAGVLGFVANQTVDLGAGSAVGGSAIVTAADYSSYLPADLADGDADTSWIRLGCLALLPIRLWIWVRAQRLLALPLLLQPITAATASRLADGDDDALSGLACNQGEVVGCGGHLGLCFRLTLDGFRKPPPMVPSTYTQTLPWAAALLVVARSLCRPM